MPHFMHVIAGMYSTCAEHSDQELHLLILRFVTSTLLEPLLPLYSSSIDASKSKVRLAE